MMLLAILLIINAPYILTYAAEECAQNAANDYLYRLGTKTPYRLVANGDVEKFQYEDCVPEKIWMLVRHGTRNPSSVDIKNMKKRLSAIRGLVLENNQEPSDHLRNSDLYALQKWRFKVDTTESHFLTHEGEDEMLELGERMQRRFPELFPAIYSNTTYFFKYTASQRTKASAEYFVTGLFGRQVLKDVWFPVALKKDPILRFYKLCSKWRNDIKNNADTLRERAQFIKSAAMLSIIDSINQELKLGNGSLTADDIYLIYKMCAFETAWNRRKASPWCALLNPMSYKAMEFTEDLKYFYNDGYGFELTHQQACPAFNDMLKLFKSEATYPKSVVYFTHSGTVLKMLAHLGLYNDSKPLLHSDFEKSPRQWRVSKIDAFGSNIAVILNRCGDTKKVMVLHQERIVQLPGCDSDLCDLAVIEGYYSKSIRCNFEEICNNNS